MSSLPYPPVVLSRTYATTLAEQMDELKADVMMTRFGASRRSLSSDPYRPLYHFVNPEGNLNDPNGLCFWQGRYHLFYQAYPPEDTRQHWGHAVSDDLVRWTDLPLAIYPGIENCCFSGSTVVEEDRVIALYHGTKAGNMIAVSSDPLLLNWEKIPGNPVIPLVQADAQGRPYRVYDPCIWKEEDGYYGLSGTYWQGGFFDDCRMAQHLFFSLDLRRWTYMGPFVEGDMFTEPGEDGAVPYFWPLGDKHILLFASHQRGSQYLIGDYDRVRHRFYPVRHGRFNFGPISPGGVHAPSATPDGYGGVYVIHNINEGRPTQGWNHIMSLVRRLTWLPDGSLGIEPVASLASLRGVTQPVPPRVLPANQDVVLDGVTGGAMELHLRIDPQGARAVSVDVLRSPDAAERTILTFYRDALFSVNRDGKTVRQSALTLDTTNASLLADVYPRAPETAPLVLAEGEPLDLRIFIDRSVVEVFANGRQCVALRVYPSRSDSTGVSVRATGGDAALLAGDAWQMGSIWENQ
ncbi:MAG: glycoside hydrolase family 32 protein [candidate division Zixibacteria bacterium]|nr:glycoside hydrolase family 32 protein [candidate division Zixibacteria bacterium]